MPGLYVHIPFCEHKCLYCDFVSYSGKSRHMADYAHSLIREVRVRARERDWGEFDTVFFGGGTPSLLPIGLLLEIYECIKKEFTIASGAECSIECNPGTVDITKLEEYKKSGFNRISFGIQSMDDGLLSIMGRIHTSYQGYEAIQLARAAGFTNVGADIMHGLPGQTELDYLSTIRDIIALAPEHISAYQLIIEPNTPMYEMVNKGVLKLPSEDETNIMQDIGMAFINTYGYERYEISNYSKKGHNCRHNINYWENGPYLGLGAAAHSAWSLDTGKSKQWTRFENTRSLEEYIANPAIPLSEHNLKAIPQKEEAFECVMLGLRMTKGIDLDAFYKRMGERFEDMYDTAIQKLIEKGWLNISGGFAYLTGRGMDMQNTALMEFMP